MAWLKGSTDRTNFDADIYNLLTGAVAAMQRGGGQASNSGQVTGTDAWTNLDSTNRVIRSQRTESPYSGEYGLYRGCPRFAARTTSTVFQSTIQTQLGKPTFTGAYSGGTARVYFAAFVSTTNAAPGNLASTVVTWTLVNADSGATVASGTASGWTGSSDTKLLTQGVSLTLTLGGSDQFVAGTNAVMWLRAYTTTFTQGIDYFPEAARVSGSLTVSNSSGGSNNYTGSGTDYTLVQQAHIFPQVSTTIGYLSVHNDWGGTGAGCGIAWNAGGSPPATGANYFIPATYSVYAAYFQTPTLSTLGGANIHVLAAPMDFWDATLGNGRWVLVNNTSTPKTTLNTANSAGQLFTGNAQAGSTFINFWISVKSDKIVMAFRGDPGQSGRLIVITMQRMTPLVSVDAWPWVYIPDRSGTTPSAAFQESTKYNYQNPYYGTPATTTAGTLNQAKWCHSTVSGANFRGIVTGIGVTEITNTGVSGGLPQQNPNNFDLRWWLYSVYLLANAGGSNLAGTYDITKPSGIRGRLQGVYVVASDNFTSLDELADNSGTYLLPQPTTAWGAQNTYASIAITEE